LPNVAEDYVHRIGRTGRAGNEGEAMSLVCVDELGLLKDIERLIKREIPRDVVADFEPDPSIRHAPLGTERNKSRGKQQASAGAAGKKKPSKRNSQRPPFKEITYNQGRSRKRSANKRSLQSGPSQQRARNNTREAA
jgi:ATP-dependent RNA helicase RhlE